MDKKQKAAATESEGTKPMPDLMHSRGNWSSKFGFLMAAVGSAVGLGNIWRFPYVTGEFGGALFLLVYLVIVVVLGFTMLSTEFAIGRRAQSSVLGTFKTEKRNWSFVGWMCVATCFFIVSFYSVVGGWIIKYLSGFATGGYTGTGDFTAAFENFKNIKWQGVVFNAVFLIMCLVVLAFGIKRGIEKVSKVLMPALFFMLVFVAIVSLTMPGAIEGVKFFLVPDFARIKENGGILRLIEAAMGQAFFSLSVGMGISTTYGSYLKKESNIPKDSLIICGFDSLVAIVAGFAILPAVFGMGAEPAQGPGLIFATLPGVFAKLGVFGNVVAVVFFLLILFAAVTSAISILEVLISSLAEKTKLRRVPATVIVGAAVLAVSTLVSLGESGIFKISLFSLFDMITVKLLLPVTAICMCLFTSVCWKTENAVKELRYDMKNPARWTKWWEVSVKFINPALILVIFVLGFVGLDLVGSLMIA